MKKIIQITSGKGPVECEYFVAQTYEMMAEEMKEQNVSFKIIQESEGGDSGCYQSVTLEVDDEGNFLQNWTGSILFIAKSRFRPFHKRKNWYIGVFEIAGFDEMQFDEKELQFQTMRSSGNGGQNVNKVNSAVRATHLPTKTSVVAMDSRSQLENKKLAIARLKLKIMEMNADKNRIQKENQWMAHLQLERGNPVKTIKI